MEGLLLRQQIIAEAINKSAINFSKNSPKRKTFSYIADRLESLKTLWTEFEANHEKLQTYEHKSHEYFITDAYTKVQIKYEDLRAKLMNFKPDPSTSTGQTEEKAMPSKTEELITQQNTNFRALSRLVRSIDVRNITEKWEIEDKLQMLQARWKIIDELHWKIDNLLIDTDVNYEMDFTSHEASYESTKRELHRKLNSTTQHTQSLPKIEIPTFNGNYAQWPAFLDLYSETIHNNMSLSKATKMQHLKGKLRGEAERLVQHLTVSAENYNTCWDILNHRYNNKQLLFTKQIQTFMSQPAIQHQSAYELKRLHDTSMETIHAIHNLGVDTTTWDPILVHILTGKLDSDTYTSYMETRKSPRELPVFDEFIEFLESKFTALEPVNKKKQHPSGPNSTKTQNTTREFSSSTLKENYKQKQFNARTYHVSADRSCPLCKNNYILLYCNQFQDMTPDAKIKSISQLDICQNCLYSHDKKQCTSKKRCRVCNSAHHTSLHDILRATGRVTSSGQQPSPSHSNHSTSIQQKTSSHVAGNYNEILLATLQLRVKAIDGTYVTLRCLLDQGSQINLITESAVQRLGLPRGRENAAVFGVGSTVNKSHGTVHLDCASLYDDYVFSTDALVMTKVLNNLPNYSFGKKYWPHLQNITLADPDYNISRPVDILLDAGVYADIVTGGILRGPTDAPVALQTKVGWVLLGNMKTYNCHALIQNLDEISQFWEIEEITENTQHMTSAEEACETLYKNTTRRTADGRYVVKIPMKENYEHNLGQSKPQAVAQFRHLEKRLANNELLADSYKKFIDEYLALGHMKLCTTPREPSCFLPHHGVIRPDSTTTKLRVVFNASCKTSSGYSLNQLMECGPNLQQDIQAMIMRWRSYQYVYTADIEKFYRQILISEEDQHLQKIVWRDSTSDLLKEYPLSTVTYGTKAAPYLSMRTIKQLVMDDGNRHPLAAEILNSQLYVDDLLAGSNNIEEAKEAQNQLIALLKGGGFNIRKWASNNPTLLQNLTEDLISQNMLNFKQAESNKTLGISWNPRTDHFTFNNSAICNTDDVTTKRKLLSEISKLYDPLGWLSPVTMKAKLMFQQAWTATKSWDDPLPECIQQGWEQFKRELPTIRDIIIPRWIGNTEKHIELHGFSDASEKAYGCVVYCISLNEDGKKVIQLVAGKTKLAPLNKPITLPRLELCGALLLARLMKKVIESIKTQTVTVHGWTDSMVVLGWLQGKPSRWKAFVANRVVKITDIMPQTCWRHVKSEDNPADCTSRGLSPAQLHTHALWWEGPSWLKTTSFPPQDKFYTCEEERNKNQVLTTQTSNSFIVTLLQNYSSMARATRVLSWIMRFIKNGIALLRTRNIANANRTSHLLPTELRSALDTIIKAVQKNCFAEDILHLQQQNKAKKTSKILNLNPTIDTNGILRVGGRLGRANLNQSQKHPIILPNKHKLTELLIDQAHKTTLHGGARLTLSYLRNQYWIIGGMKTVKRCITKCIKCHRYRQQQNNQLMADLPQPRVTPSRPFTHTGVDFTGQVEVKANKGRGIKTLKAYIAVFICLCTKAIHLELVSDLSTAAFIAALKRLCARRGTPNHIYSDNGTNFVGAARTLAKERIEALKYYINDDFINYAAENNIEWHFNAPSWPTAGGLWEAAVKSLKHHLKRVLGEQKLTFEEFSTLLAQIEACLNSRPLVAITEDIDDLECLTPGHFLVGGPILSPPLTTDDNNLSLTSRWRLTERILRDFWKQWSTTYLQTLQTRSKWHYPTENLTIGDIVLVRDDHIPPAKWLMGKVIETHPGADGRVRVVTLKTNTSNSVKRPVTKLSRLPIDREQQLNQNNRVETTNPPKRQLRSMNKKRSLFNNVCTFAFIIAMCTARATSQLVNVTALDPARLVYFDKISDMRIIQDEWKMVVYYNMSTYWKSISNIEKYINYLNNQCKYEIAYQAITAQFQHELNELQHYNNVLQTEHGRRVRRGLINGVGYIANSLFGVFDERFAEKYNRDIKKLQMNENHLLNLYKQHTSIIEGEYNLLKRNEEVLKSQFSTINKRMDYIDNRLRQENQNTMITASALAAHMILANLRNIQQLILDLVTDIRHGRVDTHLLKPDEFEKQLNVISGQIPSGFSLPCINSYGCIRLMYKLARVSARLTNDFLIFEVNILLVATEQYEVSRVIPIHKIQEQRMMSVTPTATYLAVNLKKDLLIPLSTENMLACVHANNHLLLCNINIPIYDIKAADSICEAQIINNAITSSCHTKVSDCRDNWVQLHNRRAWFFECCQECTTRIFCPAGVTSEVLHNAGIVTLSNGCMLRGEHHVIYSHNDFHNEVYIEDKVYVPESGINEFLTVNNTKSSLNLPESHQEQLKRLREHIDSVKNQQDTIIQTSSDDDVHHYVMYGFIVFSLIWLCTWGALRIKQIKQNRSQAHPEGIELTVLPSPTLATQPTPAATCAADDNSGDAAAAGDKTNISDTVHSKVDKATSPGIY